MSLTAKPYYSYFKNIKRSVVTMLPQFTTGLWSISNTDAFNRFNSLSTSLSVQYGIPVPSVQKGSREVYYVVQERIELPRISIISFLHEYRHHMQKYEKQHYLDKEDDARGWSISLFAQALPDIFDKAWKNGRIWYLPQYSPNWRQEVGLI